MKRAAELFALEARPSPSPLVAGTWRTWSTAEDAFISVAAGHWEMVVTRHRGVSRLTVRGPETRATLVPVPPDAEFFGIEFSIGTYMPGLPLGPLVDTAVSLPMSGEVFRLSGGDWRLPDPEAAEDLVGELARAGLLVHDPIAVAAVEGEVDGLSTRSQERRVARATGLSRGALRRIRRAERAVALLAEGTPASEVAHRTGYADQAHLTRSLRRLVGQTPARIARSSRGE